jgi:hypothetical protein
MKKPYRLLVYDIFENLGRIEELCMSVSFYFSKIYDIEADFYKRSKYARISKQVVFLTIQRSSSMVHEILHKIDMLEQNGIVKSEKLKPSIFEIQELVKVVERAYKQESYEGIVKQLEVIGDKCATVKDKFKKKV